MHSHTLTEFADCCTTGLLLMITKVFLESTFCGPFSNLVLRKQSHQHPRDNSLTTEKFLFSFCFFNVMIHVTVHSHRGIPGRIELQGLFAVQLQIQKRTSLSVYVQQPVFSLNIVINSYGSVDVTVTFDFFGSGTRLREENRE